MLEKLYDTQLFNQLPETVVAKYLSHCHIQNYKKKEQIFWAGEHSGYMYLVTKGRIRVMLCYPNGKEFTLTILEPGDVFSGHTRACGEALTDSEVVFIPLESIRKMLVEVSSFTMSIISVLSDTLKNCFNIIESQVFKEVNKRLYQYLYGIAISVNCKGESPIQVKLGLTHQQIATIVGSTRQTVTTFFNNLQKEGLIILEKDKLTILDFEGIASRAKDD